MLASPTPLLSYSPEEFHREASIFRWSGGYLSRQSALYGTNEAGGTGIRELPPHQHSSLLGGRKGGRRRRCYRTSHHRSHACKRAHQACASGSARQGASGPHKLGLLLLKPKTVFLISAWNDQPKEIREFIRHRKSLLHGKGCVAHPFRRRIKLLRAMSGCRIGTYVLVRYSTLR